MVKFTWENGKLLLVIRKQESQSGFLITWMSSARRLTQLLIPTVSLPLSQCENLPADSPSVSDPTADLPYDTVPANIEMANESDHWNPLSYDLQGYDLDEESDGSDSDADYENLQYQGAGSSKLLPKQG